MIRINLWSGPRNISTAMMYSFAQRKDTTVFDEPLYAHYLSKSPAFEYHPGADKILETMENDGEKVVEMMMQEYATPVAFFKHMAHHLIELDWAFMENCINVILTRTPRGMLPSYHKQVETPTLYDVGYKSQIEILDYLQSKGQKVIVLDAKQVLLNPKKVLSELCDEIGILFDEAMLQWEAGAIPEDGCWAEYWYNSVHKSTTFLPYRRRIKPLPEHLEPLMAECMPYYERLEKLAIKA